MLTVYPLERSRGILRFEDREYPCALGCNDVQNTKREGDGATPAGIFFLRQVFYRADRLPPPTSGLPVRVLGPDDGWCDDPGHRDYNRFVRLPFEASHEALWREDNLYDVIVVVGHNDDPPLPGSPRMWGGIPIICSNMASIAGENMANALSERYIITCLHKYYIRIQFVN